MKITELSINLFFNHSLYSLITHIMHMRRQDLRPLAKPHFPGCEWQDLNSKPELELQWELTANQRPQFFCQNLRLLSQQTLES